MGVVAGRTRRSFRYTLSHLHAVDMQQFIRCQMARTILVVFHYSSTIIVQLPEEAKIQVQPGRSCGNFMCMGGSIVT